MDFQRLHRIMGVKFTPEKPDSVQEIVKASLSHEQRNASLPLGDERGRWHEFSHYLTRKRGGSAGRNRYAEADLEGMSDEDGTLGSDTALRPIAI